MDTQLDNNFSDISKAQTASYQQAADKLFEAMDIITSKRINSVGFDKTLVCTIESVVDAKNGSYRVTDGTSHFQAYSDLQQKYSEGQKVYVTIPGGNMDNQKIITGRYIASAENYVPFVSALNSFVDITDNIIENFDTQFTLKANGKKPYVLIWNYEAKRIISFEKQKDLQSSITTDLKYNIDLIMDDTSLSSEEKEEKIESLNSFYNLRIKYITSNRDYDDLVEEVNNLKDIDEDKKITLLEDLYKVTTYSGYKGYERLGISGNFLTFQLDSRTIKGSYGLRLDLLGNTENEVTEFQSYFLDSSEMFGNPYRYITFSKQEALFDISRYKEILKMRLTFYQNSDFILENGKELNSEDLKIDDIILQSPYVALGFSMDSFDEDTIIFNTRDSLMYSSESVPINRNIYMRWIHKNGEKFYAIDESSETPNSAIIHWYRYKIEQDRKDELAGEFWKEIIEVPDLYNYTFTPNFESDIDAFKVIIEIPSRYIITQELWSNTTLSQLAETLVINIGSEGLKNSIDDMINETNVEALTDTYTLCRNKYISLEDADNLKLFDDIYNLIIEERSKTKYYTSDTLIFNNAIPQTMEALDLIKSLSISIDENGYKGIYRLYDETYHIINNIESSKLRILKAEYSSVITGIDVLDSAEEITWYFPISNTMIQKPEFNKEYTEDDIFNETSERKGYMSIKRFGTDSTEKQEPGVELIKTNQYFRIKDHYTQSASNNTIYCVVRKRGRDYEASISLLFGTSGSNGTEATFLLKMYDGDTGQETSALTLGKNIKIVPELYDFNNIPIPIVGNKVSYKWINKPILIKNNDSSDQEENNKEDSIVQSEEIENSILYLKTNTDSIEDCQCYILKAEIPYSIITGAEESTESRNITLSAFLPIPIRISEKYVEIEGATRIIYDTTGANPRYYKGSYKLFGENLEQFTNITWEGYSPDFLNNQTNKWNVTAKNYFPKVSKSGEFQPQKMYYQGNGLFCVNAYEEENMVWTQPIFIAQNRYASAMLNDWDGDLTIDEKNGTILSAMIGAGKKNTDNSFSGVLMGQIGKAFNNDNIGIYGYNGGEQSFSLDINGKATLGKSGSGQIRFDGNKGTITSGNYQENKAGMQIDLDDPFLKAYGVAGSAVLNLSREDKDLFTISGIIGYDEDEKPKYKSLLNIGAGNYFLQSIDFSKEDAIGLNFDLYNGKLTAYNFELYMANKIADNLFSSIKLASSGNPYFQIHYASEKKYENVPVFKVYEPNVYYYFDAEGNFDKDESLTYTQDRVYYNEDRKALNIVNPNIVYGRKGNTFYLYVEASEEQDLNNHFELVPEYVSSIQYYSAPDEEFKIVVINDAYAYESGKFYTIDKDNDYILDTSEYFTPGRVYYDNDRNQLTDILDNKKYKNFNMERDAGNLYISIDGAYKLDTSDFYTPNRFYYMDNLGKTQAKVVSNIYEIFKENTYYQKIIINEVTTYIMQNTYYSDMQYYKDVVTDEAGNQTATAVFIASPDSVYYEPNKYYYFIESNWRKVERNENFIQDANYAILEDGAYNNGYFIINSGDIYKPDTYYYIKESSTINYSLSYEYKNNVQYYIDVEGVKTPVRVIQETDTLKVFKPNTYYRYYKFDGAYREAEGDYNPYNTYYILITRDNKKVYEPIELINGNYEFEANKFYIYNENSDGYVIASQFSDAQYYILTDDIQQNDLVKITKNKFELKSHDWNVSNRIGMHFDIASSGGYIEGYSEYTNMVGEKVKPKFILDWRKNRNPIDVNDGVFKVKWNGETICTNIKAIGGKIGGWTIDNNQIIGNNIVLYCSNELSAIYAGPNAKNFVDFIIEKQAVNTSEDTVSDTLEFTEINWDTLGISNDNKYFYVNDEGVLEAYIAQIQYLKAKTLYVENMYLGKRQVQWKSKKVVIATKSSKCSVLTSVSIDKASIGHQHKVVAGSPNTGGMTTNVEHSHKASGNTAYVVSSSSDTKDQIVYLG